MSGMGGSRFEGRFARRAGAVVTLFVFVTALVPQGASAREMMLDEPAEMSRGGEIATGWVFTGLTLLSIGYAAYSYQQSQDELDDADKAYDDYRNAESEADANALHRDVEDHHDKAKAAETRANIAIALTLVFAVTAFFSFSPDSAPNLSLKATTRGPLLEWRF